MTAWKVIDQEVMAGGGNVTYETDDGATHTMFVGTPDYNPTRITALINADINNREAVANLTGDTGPKVGS